MLKQRIDRQRRYALVRAVATLTGDFATGFAFGSMCSWIIATAALGTFLSFLAWLIAILLTMLVSQHIVHPSAKFLLSDHKLDDTVQTFKDLYGSVVGRESGAQDMWRSVRRGALDLRDRLRSA